MTRAQKGRHENMKRREQRDAGSKKKTQEARAKGRANGRRGGTQPVREGREVPGGARFVRTVAPGEQEQALRLNVSGMSRGVYRNLTAADGVFAFTRTSGAGDLTVIANAGSAPYAFAADTAYVDLLTGRPFKGKVAPGEAVILKPADV